VRRFAVLLAPLVAALAFGVSGSQASQATADYLSVAQQGVYLVNTHWWNNKAGWYNDTFQGLPPSMPLARLWSAYPLFETLNAIAVAQPTAANKAALATFADKAAKLYWNPDTKPVGGYGYYPGMRGQANVYFDDSAWWGLSFIDAYQSTGYARYLTYAGRAMRFIVLGGWDNQQGGGIWWDTFHHHKTIEPLAAAVLIGTRLYEAEHRDTWALNSALKLLDWANAHSFNKARGLYQRNATDKTVMDYVQGLMATANWELCKTLKKQSYCTKARQIANASLVAFPQDLNWAPQFDVVYLRWMLEYYKETGDARFYNLAVHNAQRALAAVNQSGYYLNKWDGTPLADGLEEQAANLELFAWVAAMPAPPS
jgi:Glycosyl hydrolase family 76